MIHRCLLLILAIALPALASATAPIKPRLIVTVSLSKNTATIQKFTKRGPSELVAQIVPIYPGSVRPGTYKALRMTDRYKSTNGNVTLENVVRIEGEFNIRTSRMFERWVNSGRPAVRAIVLEAETGSLLFTTIRQYGLDKTLIRIIP